MKNITVTFPGAVLRTAHIGAAEGGTGLGAPGQEDVRSVDAIFFRGL